MGDLNRLIDNGWMVVLFKNALGSYTAFALEQNEQFTTTAMDMSDYLGRLTDDFSPDKAMKRLADKVLGVVDYAPG